MIAGSTGEELWTIFKEAGLGAILQRRWPLVVLVLCGLLLVWVIGPIPQDPAYHVFADTRSCGWVPNCLNVLSNLPFVLLGILGLRRVSTWPCSMQGAIRVFWWGILLTGLGSAWYHWAPDYARLAWDRLPMTLAFMGLFAAILNDQFEIGDWIWPLLVLTGLASIGVWLVFDDLRLYGLVQFLPPVIIVWIFWRFPPARISRRAVWIALGCYALAKLAEYLDGALFELTGWVSGHSLKHLLAALAVVWLIRKPLQS